VQAHRARTHHGFFVLLRRLRRPLVVVILAYAVAILGFVIVPGETPDGQPWRMDFLHAVYFVSFLGSTIGLGEIPYPFTPLQRLWGIVAIYLTVVAWLYSFGALLTVLQDPQLRRLWMANRFESTVRRMRTPFYLLCGYDEAGRRVTAELAMDGVQVVVVEQDASRVEAVDVDDHPLPVPALEADAGDPQALLMAGLTHAKCLGVMALTGSDSVNTKVALTAKLLAPKVPVMAVAHEHDWHPRMAATGAAVLINPFDVLADRVVIALKTPSLHVVYEALTAQRTTVAAPLMDMRMGRWVIAGWGPMARALRHRLLKLGVEVFLVDTELDNGCDADHSLRGDPTDPKVLRRARLDQAQVLVAAMDDDLGNLAVVMAARQLAPKLFVVAHQLQRRNTPAFRAMKVDLLVARHYLVASEVLRHTRAPLLEHFLTLATQEDERWAATLLEQLRRDVGDTVLESWALTVAPEQTPSVCEALARSEPVSVRRLLQRIDREVRDDESGRAVTLLLLRGDAPYLLPHPDTLLLPGDTLLLAGCTEARTRMRALSHTHGLAPLPVPSTH
jgi:voltage-gated potassium channel